MESIKLRDYERINQETAGGLVRSETWNNNFNKVEDVIRENNEIIKQNFDNIKAQNIPSPALEELQQTKDSNIYEQIKIIVNELIKKSNKTDVDVNISNLIKQIDFDELTGIFTFTRFNGNTFTIDTILEKVPVKAEIISKDGVPYLKLTNEDGSYTESIVADLIRQILFKESDTIVIKESISGEATDEYSFGIKEGSIEEKYLSETFIKKFNDGIDEAVNAAISANNSANTAGEYANTAREQSINASNYASEANNSKTEAYNDSLKSRSYAVGGTGVRINEDNDNSKYYSEQSKSYAAESLKNVNDTKELVEQAKEIVGGDYVTNSTYNSDMKNINSNIGILEENARTTNTQIEGINSNINNIKQYTINGKQISTNPTLTAEDVNARNSSWMPTAVEVKFEDGETLDKKIDDINDTKADKISTLPKYEANTTYATQDMCYHKGEVWTNTSGDSTQGVEPGTNYNIWNVGYSNPNLLDNPWFTVNQRGWTSGTPSSGNVYTVDRWKIYDNTTLVKDDNGITITAGSSVMCLYQYLNPDLTKQLAGKVCTISVMLQTGEVLSAVITLPEDYNTTWDTTEIWIGNFMFDVIKIEIEDCATFRMVNYNPGETISICAVKLELGPVSTLANDSEPDYATELLKCQRYFQKDSIHTTYYTSSALALAVNVFLKTNMRTVPSITITECVYWDGSTWINTGYIIVDQLGSTGYFSCWLNKLPQNGQYNIILRYEVSADL